MPCSCVIKTHIPSLADLFVFRGLGSLVCCSPWGRKDWTWLSNWTEEAWSMAYSSPVYPSSQSLVARVLAGTDASLSRHVVLPQASCGSVVLPTLCCLPTELENCVSLPWVLHSAQGPWNNTVFFCVPQISSWKRLLKFSRTALHLGTQALWVELSWWDGSRGVPFPAPSVSQVLMQSSHFYLGASFCLTKWSHFLKGPHFESQVL